MSEHILSTCATLCLHATHLAAVDLNRVVDFVEEHFTPEKIAEIKDDFSKRFASPLIFDTVSQELNFTFVNSLLAFGSGYRRELHEYNQRGAADTMLYGILSLHMAYGDLTTDVLANISLADVCSMFSLPLHEEYDVAPAVRGYRAAPLKPLTEAIHKALTETAAVLRTLDCADFATYLRRTHTTYTRTRASGDAEDGFLQYLLRAVMQTFPIFADEAEVVIVPEEAEEGEGEEEEEEEEKRTRGGDGNVVGDEEEDKKEDATMVISVGGVIPVTTTPIQKELVNPETTNIPKDPRRSATDVVTASQAPTQTETQVEEQEQEGQEREEAAIVRVCIGKKAQLLMAELVGRVGAREPCLRGCEEQVRTLTVFADNVLPAMMEHMGLLHLSPRYTASIARLQPLSTSAAYTLRAATVMCGEVLLDFINMAPEAKTTAVAALQAVDRNDAYISVLSRYITEPVPVLKQSTRECVVEAEEAKGSVTLPVVSRTRLTGAELDYFFYKFGKVGNNRKVTRHIYKRGSAY